MRILIASTLAATALLAALSLSMAESQGNDPFCLKAATGALNCGFQTMAQCEQSKRGNTESCVARPATKGIGGGMEAPRGTGPNSLDRQPQR